MGAALQHNRDGVHKNAGLVAVDPLRASVSPGAVWRREQGFSPRSDFVLLSRGDKAISGAIFGCQTWRGRQGGRWLLASSG